jgi:hypothetical protein
MGPPDKATAIRTCRSAPKKEREDHPGSIGLKIFHRKLARLRRRPSDIRVFKNLTHLQRSFEYKESSVASAKYVV